MEQIVVKTEVQNNGEILLYYVDENGDNQEGVLTTIENIENDSMQIQESPFMLEGYDEIVDPQTLQDHIDELDPWIDEEVKRLLIFYIDNKTSFVSGSTQKRHLWAVACKTMLIGKNQQNCEEKLEELKTKYFEVRGYIDRGIYVKWPFLELCHQAFQDSLIIDVFNDTQAISQIQVNSEPIVLKQEIETVNVNPAPPAPPSTSQVKSQPKVAVLKTQEKSKSKDGILSMKKLNSKPPDENVEQILTVYLKYKKNFQNEHWRRDLWERIAEELGETDSEYIQKKFLNHKQHYILMYMKRKQHGPSSITWPYMDLFDKIYKDDQFFLKKHFNEETKPEVIYTVPENEWNITQKTVLAKYYFDCYEEFQDETIPKKFLWTEVGRLIDKKPETCQTRYEMLRREHIEKYLTGEYKLKKRVPIAIIFDNIIVNDVKTVLSTMDTYNFDNDEWKEEEVDELVQFFFANMEFFKDKECHFVCWAVVAHKLKQSVQSCKHQWDELVVLYRQILNDKKEDSDLQIEWRYIDLFDRIFDYGMDTELLEGYEVQIQTNSKSSDQVVKIVNTEPDSLELKVPVQAQKKKVDSTKNDEPRTDPRSAKLLEHYLKNKEKFYHEKNKLLLWEPLAKQIGLSSTQCAHRFKTLKQIYMEHVQKEIEKPRMPITWPYYALCKKVFGHRMIKNKLKQRELNKKGDNNTDPDDWPERLIKLLISFFSKNFHEITNNIDDLSKWAPLASDIGKTVAICKEKFIELRKSYRKLKTMRTRNPDVKISWIYFDLFDKIYTTKDSEFDGMEVETLEEQVLMEEEVADDDYQCIIVLQDGQVILNNSEVINNPELMQQLTDLSTENNYPAKTSKWTKRAKKRLLIFYINFIRSSRGKEIHPKDLWSHVAAKFTNKTAKECKKMFFKMKNAYKQANEEVKKNSPFSFLLENVLKLKPKFLLYNKLFVNSQNNQERVYKDVPMDSEKVTLALQYYLKHIEEFVNPKFERKYLWAQLASYISEPITKAYNKLNFLKQAYDIETEEIEGKPTEFSDLLKEIIAKEVAVKTLLETDPSPDFSDQENIFTDDETEQLMQWYLGNLDKFKNPKFNRSYLWMEASSILSKSPLVCSKKMSEVRSQYRNMVRQGDELNGWRFFELCQKIYGTGKRSQNSLS